ncbi:MAG: phosphoadenylyl-sulfate reductase [Bdellovibrionales bacterium]
MNAPQAMEMAARNAPADPDKVKALDTKTERLNQSYGHLPSLELLDVTINNVFKNKIALVSSFGTEAALLLSLVAEVNKNTPVIFLDTLKHFPETLEYRDTLIKTLGLTDVRNIEPEPSAILAADPDGDLAQRNPDACCYLRKVVPLEEALHGFDAWINGRKRIHGGGRSALPTMEHDDRRIKINAIADWTQEMIDMEWEKRALPEHPMVPFGYTSVGCKPCTSLPKPGEGKRSGRWAQFDKQECGIHSLEPKWKGDGGGI